MLNKLVQFCIWTAMCAWCNDAIRKCAA